MSFIQFSIFFIFTGYATQGYAEKQLLSPKMQALVKTEAKKLKIAKAKKIPKKFSKNNPYAAKLRPTLRERRPKNTIQEAKNRRHLTKAERHNGRSSYGRSFNRYNVEKQSPASGLKSSPSQRLFGN